MLSNELSPPRHVAAWTALCLGGHCVTDFGATRKATDWKRSRSRGGFATEGAVAEGTGGTVPQLASKGGVVLTGADFENPCRYG